ncbi:MarR family transcriptional regulator [Vibrio sp. 10N.286.49.B3]|uniref:MarR family winged helix-turn-helix transcriptional regulator n=1 Tax=Vibrio sp. 10N.286.49.B3 TaxID=1880855 RepID=UPI000C83493D|nr:MarR family transcriptional regulator [Vibrio sp. 10N.286.49.B3]PMH41190.1 MarR family transcriptional regulator [Vibrio sp. 10N.286.49.B3]
MSLGFTLEKIERFAAKIWRTHCKDDPFSLLSFNEYDYLKVVQNAQPSIRLTDLASELQVTKPSATNMTKRLEKKGLVLRRPCMEDARSKRIELTAMAQEALKQESEVYMLMADVLKKKLNAEETKQLEALLAKATASV